MILMEQQLSKILEQPVYRLLNTTGLTKTQYIVVRRDTKVYNVLKGFLTDHPPIIIVIDEERRPLGYITDMEILSLFTGKRRYSSFSIGTSLSRLGLSIEKFMSIPIERIMERKPVIAHEANNVYEVISLVHSFHSPIIVIVDENNRLKTVITTFQLLRAILETTLRNI